MKKTVGILLAVVVTMFFALNANAGPKPPKYICFNWSPAFVQSLVVIKPAGNTAPYAGGRIKFYSINGEFVTTDINNVSAPLVGTGHMDGDTFHFSVTGSTYSTEFTLTQVAFHLEGFWNVTTKTGTGSGLTVFHNPWTSAPGTDFRQYTLQEVDCSTFHYNR